MFDPDKYTPPTAETYLDLADISYIVQLIGEHYEQFPNSYDRSLASRLQATFAFWRNSKGTTFRLKLKK